MRLLHIPKIVFDSSHYIPGYDGKCGNVHGHSWSVVDLCLGVVDDLNEQGISVDFGDIKHYFEEEWDHKLFVPTPDHVCWCEHYNLLLMDPEQIKPLEHTTCEYIADVIAIDLLAHPGISYVCFQLFEGASESSGGVSVVVEIEEDEE